MLAFVKLGREKGYELVGCDTSGVNAFFMLSDEIKKHKIPLKNISEYYHYPTFGDIWEGKPTGWPISNKVMIDY